MQYGTVAQYFVSELQNQLLNIANPEPYTNTKAENGSPKNKNK